MSERLFTSLYFWVVLGAVFLICFCGLALGQWGGGGCLPAGPVGPMLFAQSMPSWTLPPAHESSFEWKTSPDGWYKLFRDGRQLGCWKRDVGYRRLLSESPLMFGQPTLPPVEPPQVPAREPDKSRKANAVESNFGMNWDGKTGCRYKINGKEADKKQVMEALTGDGKVADDSAVLRLIVKGKKAETDPVVTDIRTNPALAKFQGKLLVYECDQSDWRAAGYADGTPSITLVRPDKGNVNTGKVLYRQADYAGGATALAVQLEKRIDPSYNPAVDPGPNLLNSIPDMLAKVPMWGWVIAGGAGIYFYSKRKK